MRIIVTGAAKPPHRELAEWLLATRAGGSGLVEPVAGGKGHDRRCSRWVPLKARAGR